MSRVWIAFGSNQDEPIRQLLNARSTLNEQKELVEEKASSLYQTPPWGGIEQPDFYNAVIRYRTESAPHTILHLLQLVEQYQRRVRTVKNGPRTLDLDILLFDGDVIETADLQIPHPRMNDRAFVLEPLYEINRDLRLPDGKYLSELMEKVDCSEQKKLDCADWLV